MVYLVTVVCFLYDSVNPADKRNKGVKHNPHTPTYYIENKPLFGLPVFQSIRIYIRLGFFVGVKFDSRCIYTRINHLVRPHSCPQVKSEYYHKHQHNLFRRH